MFCTIVRHWWHGRHMFHCFIDAGNIKDSIAIFLVLGTIVLWAGGPATGDTIEQPFHVRALDTEKSLGI